MKIADVVKLDTGMTVSMVEGDVKVAWELKEGTGEWGPYTTQGIVLADDTGEIVCQIGNHREIKKGEKLIIKSKEGKKGLEGIVLNEYKEKKQLKVTKSALLSPSDGSTPIHETTKEAPSKPTHKPVESHSDEYLSQLEAQDRKDRSMALAYSKDLCVAGRIDIKSIGDWSVVFYDFIAKGDKVDPDKIEIPF